MLKIIAMIFTGVLVSFYYFPFVYLFDSVSPDKFNFEPSTFNLFNLPLVEPRLVERKADVQAQIVLSNHAWGVGTHMSGSARYVDDALGIPSVHDGEPDTYRYSIL